ATTTGWSEAVESNHSWTACRTADRSSDPASGRASPPRVERGATTFGGSRRGPPERRDDGEPARSRTAPRWVAISADRWVSGSCGASGGSCTRAAWFGRPADHYSLSLAYRESIESEVRGSNPPSTPCESVVVTRRRTSDGGTFVDPAGVAPARTACGAAR